MQLMKGPDHLFHVYDQINGKQAILSSIYLQINGGSLFSPHIDYIMTKGLDAETGATVADKTRP
jgi:predicted proteasome-type protease